MVLATTLRGRRHDRGRAPEGIRQIYAPSWAVAIIGLLWSLGFSYWTFKLVQPGFTWWALLTGWIALLGLGWFIVAMAAFVSGKPLSYFFDTIPLQHKGAKNMPAIRTIEVKAPKKRCLTLADVETFVKDARAAGASGPEEVSGSTTGWGTKLGSISVSISTAQEEPPSN